MATLMLMPTDTEDIEDTTGDKFPSTSTKQKLKANITPCYLTYFSSFSAPLRRCRKLN